MWDRTIRGYAAPNIYWVGEGTIASSHQVKMHPNQLYSFHFPLFRWAILHKENKNNNCSRRKLSAQRFCTSIETKQRQRGARNHVAIFAFNFNVNKIEEKRCMKKAHFNFVNKIMWSVSRAIHFGWMVLIYYYYYYTIIFHGPSCLFSCLFMAMRAKRRKNALIV